MNKSFKVIATKTIFAAAIASALSGIALAATTEIKGDAFQTLKQPVTTGSTTVTDKSYLQQFAGKSSPMTTSSLALMPRSKAFRGFSRTTFLPSRAVLCPVSKTTFST